MGLDTVEIVISWEETFKISIPDADAMVIETPAMAINYICSRLELEPDDAGCHTMRNFNSLRRSICEITSAPRSEVRPSVRVDHFYRYSPRRRFWTRLEYLFQSHQIQRPGWFTKAPTVADLLDQMEPTAPAAGAGWTRRLVRAAVRESVREYVSRSFRDDEQFIRDLGFC